MIWWKWLKTESSLPPPFPHYIYIYFSFEIPWFLKAFVKNIKWIWVFTKYLCSTCLARFHAEYIWRPCIEVSPNIDWKLSPPKIMTPFLSSTSPNNYEFDSSNKTFAPRNIVRDAPFPPYHALYILSLVLAPNIMIVARDYIWMHHAHAHPWNDCANWLHGITFP